MGKGLFILGSNTSDRRQRMQTQVVPKDMLRRRNEILLVTEQSKSQFKALFKYLDRKLTAKPECHCSKPQMLSDAMLRLSCWELQVLFVYSKGFLYLGFLKMLGHPMELDQKC